MLHLIRPRSSIKTGGDWEMSCILELRDLNDLSRGIYKHWIWGSKDMFSLSCDYCQKINCSIQDLNSEICNLHTPTTKEIVYIIVLVGWICEAVDMIHKMLRKEVIDHLGNNDDVERKRAEEYFRSIRSFVVAHPLNTNRHKMFGMDGDLICVDLRSDISIYAKPFVKKEDLLFLDMDGLKEHTKDTSSDFVLHVYSKKRDGARFFKYIGANFFDLYSVARLQIDRLYNLGKKLNKITKAKVGIK